MGPIDEAIYIAAALCRPFEGLRLKPYLCPAGYWTQGYGTVNKPDRTKVKPGDPAITKQIAEEWLISELRNTYLPGVLAASPALIKYPRVLGAMADFGYNLGIPRYRASTLRRRVNTQDWSSCKIELAKWVYGDGVRLPGLVKRRYAETLFLP